MFNNTWLAWVFKLNPMAHFINAYRDIFYVHQIPNLSSIFMLIIIGLLVLTVCYLIFKKLEKRFAEEV